MSTQKYIYGQQLYTIKAATILPFVPVTILNWHGEIWYQGPTGSGLVLTVKQSVAFDSAQGAVDHYQTQFIADMKSLYEQAKALNPTKN